MKNNLLRVRDVADELGVTRQRVHQLIVAGVIPHVRITPRSIRIPRASWEAFKQVKAEEAIDALKSRDVEDESQ